MLTDLCTPESLAIAYARAGKFSFPADELPDSPAAKHRLDLILARARAELVLPWPELTATLFLRYQRDGNRSEYERAYFARRNRLGAAALAWAATKDPIFADAVADGVWLICEESTWCLPAHFKHGAPDESSQLPGDWPGSIDLFNSETAQCLAEVCQLTNTALDTIDPAILRRAKAEILRRVITPLIQSEVLPHWGEGTSNWGPWCASCLIAAAGWVLHDDPKAWGALVHRLLGTIARYIDRQGADGGCDEGVSYWNVAGGAAIRALHEVDARAPGALDFWQNAKLGQIARYPVRMHLGESLFPAFGDTVPKARLWSGLLARTGMLIAAPELVSFAQSISNPVREVGKETGMTGELLQFNLRALWWLDSLESIDAEVLRDAWLPQLQVLVAHGGGLSLAVKGGHNLENHNHNDVGQFVVHYKGQPVLVDAGRGEYTAQTFGPHRYDLWWPSAKGHAIPILDGQVQATGWEYQARAVNCELLPDHATISMDLSACYRTPNLIVERRVSLDRNTPSIEIRDRVGHCMSYELPLRFAIEPKPDGDDWLVGGLRLITEGLTSKLQRVDLTHERTLSLSWPQGLWLLTLSREIKETTEIAVVLRPA